ncbi:MAG TPA: transposase [Terriglobia bacterium]|nr:transposase [Terriglobia bacterium]
MKGTEWARAQAATIRVKLLKIGALMRVTVRKIWMALAGGYPYAAWWARIWDQLQRIPLRS